MEIDKTYNEDCRVTMARMLAEGVKVDAVITSPPYDNIRNYGNESEWNFEVFKDVCRHLYDVCANGGVVVWVVSDATIKGSESCSSFRQALYFVEVGFRLHDTMIYQKHNPTPNTGRGKRYQQSFEYMFVFSKGTPKTTNLMLEKRRNECNDKRTFRIKKTNRDKDGVFRGAKLYVYKEEVPRSNVWNYKVGLYNSTSDKIAFKHPAIFPEQLVRDHVVSWTNEGDIVYDPFMGSGTTAKVAKNLNRRFIGSETSKEYCDIADERVRERKEHEEG